MESFTPASLDSFSQELFDKLIKATRIANKLPNAEDYTFYSSFGPFRSKVDTFGQRILDLTQGFLQQEKGHKAPIINQLEDAEEVADQFDVITDVVDSMIEKVDNLLDEVKGEKTQPNIIIAKTKAPSFSAQGEEYHLFHATNLARPQIKFERPVDNSNRSWRPFLTEKPNALIPLQSEMEENDEDYKLSKEMETHLGLSSKAPEREIPHPYEYEILNLEFSAKQLEPCAPQLFVQLGSKHHIWVDTEDKLMEVSAILDKQTEFAIDLEAHAYRSFQGFVCLMQISTRTDDYIIDTLALRSKMQILNRSFTNPNIIKVLHGADSDITWLQRDFSLYMVNMFDTGQAARVLEFPKLSLAFLLSRYCGLNVDKKYQLADWRIRPIPEPMLKYAREDTHYLLYIYDCMKNELLQKGNADNNLIMAVWNRSREICLKKYEKETLTETSHLTLYNKHNLVFSPTQMRVFSELYAWRDTIARQEDESTRFVLPNHMLIRLAEAMPSTTTGIFNCCTPVPPLVKMNAMDILAIIQDATKLNTPPRSAPFSNFAQQAPPSQISGITQRLLAPTTPMTIAADDQNKASPVLTTDQLYNTAGWTESGDIDIDKGIVSYAAANASGDASLALPTSLFFDDDGDEDEEDDFQRTAALIHSNLSQNFIAQQPIFAFGEQDTEKDHDEKEKVKEEKHKKPIEDIVPQSMSEIYKLSNQIKRKRNKDKKKMKDDKPKDDEGSEEEGRNKRAKGPTKDASNTEEFMRNIGWIDKEGIKEKDSQEKQYEKSSNVKVQNRPQYIPPSSPKKTKAVLQTSGKNFTPFDYSQLNPNIPTGLNNQQSSHQSIFHANNRGDIPRGKQSNQQQHGAQFKSRTPSTNQNTANLFKKPVVNQQKPKHGQEQWPRR